MAEMHREAQMSILFDTWLIANMTSGLLDDALLASGMSGDDFAMYSLLRAFGPASPGQVARWTGLRPTTVSAALKRLADRGHTTKSRDVADGRSYRVSLSRAGLAAHTRTASVFWDETRRLAALIGPDEPAHRQALQSLDARLRDAAGLDPRPYRLADDTRTDRWSLTYDGAPLSHEQQEQVRAYIDFVRGDLR